MDITFEGLPGLVKYLGTDTPPLSCPVCGSSVPAGDSLDCLSQLMPAGWSWGKNLASGWWQIELGPYPLYLVVGTQESGAPAEPAAITCAGCAEEFQLRMRAIFASIDMRRVN